MEYARLADDQGAAMILTSAKESAQNTESVKSGPRVVTRSGLQSPQVGALVVLGLIHALTTTALASTLGIFASTRAVEQRYSPLDAATSHASQQPSGGHGMRRMVQFLNPQDWLNALCPGTSVALKHTHTRTKCAESPSASL